MPPDSDQRRPQLRPGLELGNVRQTSARDYAIRFAFGAVISIAAHLISTGVGTRFGGMFLAFPAILPASLTLIQRKEGTSPADHDAIGAVLGGVGLAVFAMVGELGLRHLEPFAALGLALLAWLVVSTALYALLAVLQPTDL